MPTDFKISVTATSREDGYWIFTLSVTNVNNQFEYKIYAFDKDIPLKETDPNPEALERFAIDEMKSWMERSGGEVPQNRILVLMNGGKIRTNDIKTVSST